MNRSEIAKIGEEKALQYLLNLQHLKLSTNFHCRAGEIDLITFEKSTRTLVFTEVKTRTGNYFGSPQESISKNKIRKILLTINQFFLQNPNLKKYHWRIDAIAIKLTPQAQVQNLTHLLSISPYES